MARRLCGIAALAALAGLAGCSSPTSDLRNGPQAIVTDPSFALISLGESKSLEARIVDEQGNALGGKITATSSNPAALTVTEDVNFRPGLTDPQTRKFDFTGNALDSVLISFAGEGVTGHTVVKIKPLSLAAVFSTATPNVNDEVQVSAPSFKFPPSTVITFGGEKQLITGFAADSSSVTFRVGVPGHLPISVVGAAPSYLLGANFTLSSDDSLTAGPTLTSLAGTDAIATAPQVLVPDSGHVISLSDTGTFAPSTDCTNSPGGFPCRIYKIVLAGRDVDVSATWNNGSDLGVYFTDPAGVDTGLHDCDAGGQNSGAETCTITGLTGTYYMYVISFASGYASPPNTDPTRIDVTLTGN
jgi:hypothetical protein